MSSLHGLQTQSNGIHSPFRWIWADETARDAETDVTAVDVSTSCLGLILDDYTIWIALDDSPIVWQQVTGAQTSSSSFRWLWTDEADRLAESDVAIDDITSCSIGLQKDTDKIYRVTALSPLTFAEVSQADIVVNNETGDIYFISNETNMGLLNEDGLRLSPDDVDSVTCLRFLNDSEMPDEVDSVPVNSAVRDYTNNNAVKFLDAGMFLPALTSVSGPVTSKFGSGGLNTMTVWALDDTLPESIGAVHVINGEYDTTLVVDVYFAMNSATTGDVYIRLGILVLTNGTSVASVSFDETNVATPVPGTAQTIKVESMPIGLTGSAGLATGDVVRICLFRDVSNAADTASGDMLIVGMKIYGGN